VTGQNVNRQRLLVDILFQVRRHFAGCHQCRAAKSGMDFDGLCDLAKKDLVEVAVKWDSNIGRRLTARKSKDDYIYPCPDPFAHGEAYAATAEPVIVASRPGTLF
jgi:hypothetical protein